MIPFRKRAQQREIRKLLDGNHIAHWRYSEDEWLRFAEAERARSRRHIARSIPIVIALSAVVGLGVGWARSDTTVVAGVLSGIILGLPLAAVSAGSMSLDTRAAYRARRTAIAESFIGLSGVYQHGTFTSFGANTNRLAFVEFEEGQPAVIHFGVRGYRGAIREVRVPVPNGKEAEARELADRFERRIMR